MRSSKVAGSRPVGPGHIANAPQRTAQTPVATQRPIVRQVRTSAGWSVGRLGAGRDFVHIDGRQTHVTAEMIECLYYPCCLYPHCYLPTHALSFSPAGTPPSVDEAPIRRAESMRASIGPGTTDPSSKPASCLRPVVSARQLTRPHPTHTLPGPLCGQH